ncbi:Polygalacturonase [Camellia lanceoleosa]|nr:Polygalacturonase [Camellia lanceoleosa]
MKMRGLSLRSLTFMLFIALLVLFSHMGTCSARRGKHWRQNRAISASLSKNGKSHHSNAGKLKHKAPPLPPPSPPPSPPKTPRPPPTSSSKSPPSPAPAPNKDTSSTVFNVLDFGAKGDGTSDDTKAFQATWAAACKVQASTVMVPSQFTFLVGPISFSGPYCQSNIVFQLEGTIIAPTSSKAWGTGLFQWLQFTKLVGITVQGSGTIDGRGSVWWQDSPYNPSIAGYESALSIIPLNNSIEENPTIPISNSLGGNMPSIKPTALRFYGSINVTVTGITIQNSPQCHLKFDNCVGVSVFNMKAASPGDSPNTDGIHLQNSQNVVIRNSNLACGDDCVSIQTGCSNVYIHNVNCGPGHGISIGGLGKEGTKACVSNVTVRDVSIQNTMTGVRIKTWQGGSGSVQGVMFSNVQVSEVQFPIVIDQYYCDKSTCKNQTSAVALSGITYEKIRGTYTVKPVHLACSDSLPCMDVTLTDIELKPLQEQYHMYDVFCWQTFGELISPTMPPIDCLKVGKPSSNTIQNYYDSC